MFSAKVLRIHPNVVSAMLNSTKEWMDIKKTGRRIYRKVLAWIDMSDEDQQKVLDGKMELTWKETSKKRFSFTHSQVEALKRKFQLSEYLKLGEKEALAAELNVSPESITNWFTRARGLKRK